MKPSSAASFKLSAPNPAEPEAGQAFSVTLSAFDTYGNLATTYGGAGGETKTIAYSGPEASPSGKAPEYPTTATAVSFKEGVGTATAIKLYKAGSQTLTAKEGTREGTSAAFAVKPSSAASFKLSAPNPAEPEAGQAFSVTLSAFDTYGNLATTYGGAGGETKTIAYSGPEASPSGKAPEYPTTATAVSFKEGVGTATAIKLYKAAAQTLTAKEGTREGSTAAFTVKPGAFKSFSLTPVPAEPEVGAAVEVKLTALDEWHNTITSYARTHKLQYEGAENAPNGKAPEYSTTTEPTFTAGVASIPGFHFYKAASTTLKVKEETSGHEGTGTFNVKAGTAASFKLSAPTPAEPEAGQALNVTITALDAGGNLATSYGGAAGEVKTIAYSGPGASPSGKAPEYPTTATAVTFKEGVGTATAIKLYKAGSQTLTAKEGAREGTSAAFTVKAGAFKSFGLTAVPAEPEVGAVFEVKLTALDEWDNTITSYARTHKLHYEGAEASPSGRAPEYSTTTEPTFTAGVASIPGFHFYKAAATTLKVKEETSGHEGAGTFTVKPGAAATFKLSAPNPTEPEAGQAFSVTLSAFDTYGNLATSYGGAGGETKTIAYSGPEASPSGKAPEYPTTATSVSFKEGVGTATGIKLYKAALSTLTAKEGTREGSTAAFTVKPGAAASFKLSAPNPAEPEAGQAFSVTLSAFDTYGNLATTYGGAGGETKTIAYSGPEASPSGKAPEYPTTATAVSFKEGVGTATAIKLYKAGSQTLTAKEGTREGTSAAFAVKAGAFKSFGIAPVPAEPEVGAAFEVKLTALDEWHNTITSYARTHKLHYEGAETAPNGKAPEYSTTTEPTFTAGVASIPNFRFYKAASTTLKIKEETTTHEGAGTFTVKVGTAATFKLSAPTPAEPEVGAALSVTITALDAGGNLAISYGGAGGETKTIAYSGPEASPSGKAPEYPTTATSVSFKEGVGTATAIKLYKAALSTLTAKEGTREGTSAAFTVKPGAAASFKLSAPNPTEPEAGQAFSVTLSAFDTYGNLATSYGGAGGETKTIAYSGPEASPSGKAPEYPTTATSVSFKEGVGTATAIKLYKAGSQTLTAKEGAREGTGAAFTVKPGAFKSFSLAPVPAEPEVGAAFEVKLTALDEWHNTITSYARTHKLHYEGAETAPNGKAPEYSTTTEPTFTAGVASIPNFHFYKAASTTLKIKEETTTHEGAGTFTVKVGTAATFKLSAPTPAEPEVGAALSVTITALDAGGNLATSYGGAAGETKTIAYSGPEASPSGKAPEYPTTATSVSFKEGVGTATAIKLYKAGSQTLTAKEGTREGSTAAFTVKPGAFKSFGIAPVPAEPEAGVAFEVKLTAWDEWHNTVTSYARTHKLHYEGAENAPNGKAPEYSTTTEPTFTAGVASIPNFHFYKAAATTLKVKEETTTHEGAGTFTVKAGTARSFTLAAALTTVEVGQADNLTVTALDEWGNTATAFGGATGETKHPIFEGATAGLNGKAPTVTAESGTATKFGEATPIKFKSGVATVEAGNNGAMTLYRVETAHIKVREGALNNGAGLAITVKQGPISAFEVSAPTPAEPEAGQAFSVKLTAVDAGGDVITSYGGAAGEVKTIGYSGPEAAPSGTAPEYPASAKSVTFKEGVGTATAIKLYKAAATTLTAFATVGAARVEGVSRFTVIPGPAKYLIWNEPEVSAGSIVGTCLDTCLAEGLGSEGRFTAEVSLVDSWANPQPTHGGAVTVRVHGRAVVGRGGRVRPGRVTIAAGAATSEAFTFTGPRIGSRRTPTAWEELLEATATGYEPADATLRSETGGGGGIGAG